MGSRSALRIKKRTTEWGAIWELAWGWVSCVSFLISFGIFVPGVCVRGEGVFECLSRVLRWGLGEGEWNTRKMEKRRSRYKKGLRGGGKNAPFWFRLFSYFCC